MAWLDPMCGLMLAFVTAAALWRRRSGKVAQVDFSMIEAMLWTMAQPLLAAQLPGDTAPVPDQSRVYRCPGPDEWLGVAQPVPAVPADHSAASAASLLISAGVPAAALARSADLVACEHLQERGFWDPHSDGVAPGLPWRASFGRATGPAPGLGADTEQVLRDVAGMSPEQIMRVRASGALG